ncbi:MAG: phosphate ABC transporter permease subunit PstC [Candidatus Thermoplasmatota archaeon]|nr:phosphate ABC transporter permease subunit PstC [Candidatus Thermoplasmatota archaeon]
MALTPVLIIIGIVSFLFFYSYPSIFYNGSNFLTSITWYTGLQGNVVQSHGFSVQSGASFGILVFLVGTLLTSGLALLIALPASFFISISVEFYLPSRIKSILISFIELFAGIPSVVYGFWGVLFLEPILYNYIEPWMSASLGSIPVLGLVFGGQVTSGYGIIISAIILSIMIIPIITSVMTNSLDKAPKEVRESIYSMGATKWEVGRYLLSSFHKSSTWGGAMLGLGRALGETMAVWMVAGGLQGALPSSLYGTINTMAAWIASQLDSAYMDSSGMTISALAELSLILMGVSLIASVIGRRIAGRGALRGYQND